MTTAIMHENCINLASFIASPLCKWLIYCGFKGIGNPLDENIRICENRRPILKYVLRHILSHWTGMVLHESGGKMHHFGVL